MFLPNRLAVRVIFIASVAALAGCQTPYRDVYSPQKNYYVAQQKTDVLPPETIAPSTPVTPPVTPSAPISPAGGATPPDAAPALPGIPGL